MRRRNIAFTAANKNLTCGFYYQAVISVGAETCDSKGAIATGNRPDNYDSLSQEDLRGEFGSGIKSDMEAGRGQAAPRRF